MSLWGFVKGVTAVMVGAHAIASHMTADGHVADSVARATDVSSLRLASDLLHVEHFWPISMNDTVRFDRSSVALLQGQTLDFELKNDGHLVHNLC